MVDNGVIDWRRSGRAAELANEMIAFDGGSLFRLDRF